MAQKIFLIFLLISLPSSAERPAWTGKDIYRFLKIVTDNKESTLFSAQKEYQHPYAYPNIDFIGVLHEAIPEFFRQIEAEIDSCDVVLYEFKDFHGVTSSIRNFDSCHDLDKLKFASDYSEGLAAQHIAMKNIDFGNKRFIPADLFNWLGDIEENTGDSCDERFIQKKAQLGLENNPDPVKTQIEYFKKNPQNERANLLQSTLKYIERYENVSNPGIASIPIRHPILFTELDTVLEQKDLAIRKICILYGAGHGPDIENHLIHDLGYQLKDEQWREVLSVPNAQHH